MGKKERHAACKICATRSSLLKRDEENCPVQFDKLLNTRFSEDIGPLKEVGF